MGDRSAAARKAARTRKRQKKGYERVTKRSKELGSLFAKKSKQKHIARVAASKRPKKKKKKGKKMPANVKKYLQLRGQGMSKEQAREEAGLPKASGKKKKWGPGHPLYEWQKKHKR